ncbi:substrate-binding domain-containing protein [Streptomyces sp. NPDC059166]|uniref:substrate-binding domain-containing protein n=1 Tax=Streptomyces sp. NPDC059166 TaxID=3346752 RepID=UPI0036C6DA0C
MSSALKPSGELEGRVTVGASALLLETRVGSLVQDCRHRYPKVQVSPRQLVISNAARAVQAHEVDLALVHGDFAGGARELPGRLVVEELPDLEVVPVGSVELARDPDRTRAFSQVRVLAVDPDCSSHRVMVTALREIHGIEPQVIEAGSVGGARELARVGYGIAMLPAESVRVEGEGSGLAVLPGLPRVRLGVRALWAGRELASAPVSAFREVAVRAGRQREAQPA